jgi:hypothetical protein
VLSKCPKCEDTVMALTINGVGGSVFFGKTWNCITLCCPNCDTVLGAQIDPIAIKSDTLTELVALLRK